MPRNPLLLLPLLLIAESAQAYDPIVLDRGWQQLAHAENGDCEAEARGNGQIVYIYATGLGADEAGRYFLTNGTMKPIDWDIQADGNGEWARYYIPARPSRSSGTVNVTIATGRCSLDLAFQWRTGIPVIEMDGTRHIEPGDDAADVLFDY